MRRLLTCFLFVAALLAPAFASAASTTLLISEFRTRGPNGANDEFIELFNVSATANVNLTGISVMASDSSGVTTLVKTLPANIMLVPHEYYLLGNNAAQGYSGTVAANAFYSFGIPDDGGIAILNASHVVIDQVGMSAGSAYKEGTPLTPFVNNVNQSYERNNGGCGATVDTDNNISDFRFNSVSSGPQNSTFNCATATCAGISCKSPPSSCYAATGTCSQGACSYAALAEGATCTDGNACTVGDTCDASQTCNAGPVTACTTPPADFCSNATTLVKHSSSGTCSTTTGCTYTATNTNCQFGCDGVTKACKADPCTGNSCNTPPNDCVQPTGTCINDPSNSAFGTCVYTKRAANTACSDGNACTVGDACNGSGSCVPGAAKTIDDMEACTVDACNTTTGVVTHTAVSEGTDCDDGDKCNGIAVCASGTCTNSTPVSCKTPPAGGCYATTGTCNPANGACTYQPSTPGAACDDTSACTTSDQCDGNGLCGGSAVVCNPGTPTCVDSTTSRTFSTGTCQAASGNCSVVSTDKTCAFGCDTTSGLCKQDPCIGVTCNTPPAGGCYQTTGTCSGGACTYITTPDASCDDGDPCTGNDKCSAAGACAGAPLACNTPPLSTCKDANTSTKADVTGTCANAVCTYQTQNVGCSFGCDAVSGLCKGDPCIGITCDTPPDQCHQATGTCAGGTCTYELKPTSSTCDDHDACTTTDVCDATGKCAGQPKTCNDPPKATCAANTSTTYDASGTCQTDGTCTYTKSEKDCATTCDTTSGLCKGDKCEGVTCDKPTGVCYVSKGTCADGTCSYDFRDKNVSCDDGDDTTMNDVCNGKGKCAGTAPSATPDGGVDAGAGGRPGAGGTPSNGGIVGASGSGGTGAGGKTGNGGSVSTAGSGTVDAGTGPSKSDGGTTVAGGGGSGSCGCSVPRSTNSPAWPVGLLALSALAIRRRRR